MLRRRVLALLTTAPLAACGFKLRTSQALPFDTLGVAPENAGGVAADLVRYLGNTWRPLVPQGDGQAPEAVLTVLQEAREKIIVALNASGQVREFELRLRVRFRLRGRDGSELIPDATIEQRRSISFSESAVLAKEAEEALLYRDMQADVVQQLLRRLASVKRTGSGDAATPAASAEP